MKIEYLIGVSGSGREDYAESKESDTVVVIRKRLIERGGHKTYKQIYREERDLADKALADGHDIIVDSDGFSESHKGMYRRLAKKYDAELIFNDEFAKATLDDCLSSPWGSVDKDKTMASYYGNIYLPSVQKEWDKDDKPCYIVSAEALLRPERIANRNTCNLGLAHLCDGMLGMKYAKLILISSTKEQKELEKSLYNAMIDYNRLIVYKNLKEMYKTKIEGRYRVLGVFTDDVEPWIDLGIMTFKIGGMA